MAPGPSYRIRYTISKNRFCENVKRAHKSNGIAIEVDLTFLVLTQVCYDLDCKGYRSEPVALPAICCTVLCHISNMIHIPIDSNLDNVSNSTSRKSKYLIEQNKNNEAEKGINCKNENIINDFHLITLHQKCDQLYEIMTISKTAQKTCR